MPTAEVKVGEKRTSSALETVDAALKKAKMSEVVIAPQTTRKTEPLTGYARQDFLRLRASLEGFLAMMEKGEKPSNVALIQCGLLPNATIDQVKRALTGAQRMITLYKLDAPRPAPTPVVPSESTTSTATGANATTSTTSTEGTKAASSESAASSPPSKASSEGKSE